MYYGDFLNSQLSKGLTDDQRGFFKEFLSSDNHIALFGGAGVGKSHSLNVLSDLCESSNILLSKTASTGIAAINIQGQTLHSFMGLGIGNDHIEIILKKVKKNKRALQRIKSCSNLVIDEISMISGELLDKVYAVFERYKGKQPRYIFLGDALQLPFVAKEDKQFFFESSAWGKINPTRIVLTTIMRQDKESQYAKALERVRVGDNSVLRFFDSRIVDECPDNTLMAFCKNIDVDSFNNQHILKLKGDMKTYISIDFGQEPFLTNLKKNCLAPEFLKLKVGAQVMLLKNMIDEGLYNGSVGKVLKLNNNSVQVDFNGNVVEISADEWKIEESFVNENGKVKTKRLASRTQIPLKVAYAITIHRLQGMTVDKLCVDLDNCFECGQFYTALSRARTLDGLYITNMRPSSMKTSQKCLDFNNS